MEIIEADLSKLPELAELFDEYRRFYQYESDRDEARRFLEQRLTNQDSVILLAIEQKKAMGFVQIYPSFSSLLMKPVWILYDLFVAPEFRGHSVGLRLLQTSEALARKNGITELTLKTAVTNQTARKLYESQGWKLDSQFLSYDRCLD